MGKRQKGYFCYQRKKGGERKRGREKIWLFSSAGGWQRLLYGLIYEECWLRELALPSSSPPHHHFLREGLSATSDDWKRKRSLLGKDSSCQWKGGGGGKSTSAAKEKNSLSPKLLLFWPSFSFVENRRGAGREEGGEGWCALKVEQRVLWSINCMAEKERRRRRRRYEYLTEVRMI